MKRAAKGFIYYIKLSLGIFLLMLKRQCRQMSDQEKIHENGEKGKEFIMNVVLMQNLYIILEIGQSIGLE